MDRYYIYIDWKNGETTEGFYIAKTKQDAIKQALKNMQSKDEIFDICVFKELRNVKL